ncbi:amidohydrolase family protein [Burkholderia ubonensis]|uniref:amidohydrolase family protein n=1 Tax=Burkholderia ubonensis TaxID=101571 RepID=UPI0009B41801|nr:amidohydrolase family protein [Burkholderia ubonensis]
MNGMNGMFPMQLRVAALSTHIQLANWEKGMKMWSIMAILMLAVMSNAAASPAKLPFGLFDAHAHFYTDNFSAYPLHPERAYMGAQKLTEIVLARPNTPEYVLKLWDENGIESGTAVQYYAAYQFDNRYVFSVARDYPHRIVPVVMLDANDPATPNRLRKFVKHSSVVGLRLSVTLGTDGTYPSLDSPRAHAVWAAADSLQLPIIVFPLVHGADSHDAARNAMRRVLKLARRYPNVRVVLDHCGWPSLSAAPDYGITGVYRQLAAQKNIYLKVTTVNFNALHTHGISASAFMRHAVDTFGADRIMWGSDLGNTSLPYPKMVDEAIAATASLSETERKQVLRDTGHAVFGGRLKGSSNN